MNDYHCKNCDNIVGKWNNKYEWYDILNFCKCSISKKNEFIYFLDCENCKKFVGIACYRVCSHCFGEKKIFEEKKLFKWFLEYKKIIYYNYDLSYSCNSCNKNNFRYQYWFFKELTFHKNK